jgi:hypothetical protein
LRDDAFVRSWPERTSAAMALFRLHAPLADGPDGCLRSEGVSDATNSAQCTLDSGVSTDFDLLVTL